EPRGRMSLALSPRQSLPRSPCRATPERRPRVCRIELEHQAADEGGAVAVGSRWRRAAGGGGWLQVAAVARARSTQLEQALRSRGADADLDRVTQHERVVLAHRGVGTDGGGVAQLGGGAGTSVVAEEGVVAAGRVGVEGVRGQSRV